MAFSSIELFVVCGRAINSNHGGFVRQEIFFDREAANQLPPVLLKVKVNGDKNPYPEIDRDRDSRNGCRSVPINMVFFENGRRFQVPFREQIPTLEITRHYDLNLASAFEAWPHVRFEDILPKALDQLVRRYGVLYLRRQENEIRVEFSLAAVSLFLNVSGSGHPFAFTLI